MLTSPMSAFASSPAWKRAQAHQGPLGLGPRQCRASVVAPKDKGRKTRAMASPDLSDAPVRASKSLFRPVPGFGGRIHPELAGPAVVC